MRAELITGRRRGRHVWQIIYMDLMTIIMVFFIILWSINQGADSGISTTIGDQTLRTVNLPGDVLFGSGKRTLTAEGQTVFAQLFDDDTGAVLNFDTGGIARRQLIIHGHTDGDGKKDDNFELGYRRAFAVYKEIHKYGADVGHHVILCTHADNTPAQEVPAASQASDERLREIIGQAKAENRRITIEDRLLSTYSAEE